MTGRGARAQIDVPVVPAAGLSVATGGAVLLGTAGLVGGATTVLPCLFSAATGVDCPFCGMTHGVAALGAGDIAAAVAANPLSPLAVALALAVGVALLTGRRLAVPAAAAWALAALIAAVWRARAG
ncbi:MAG TPA: DUF2752 domain-containing protein [Solirubrobacteraceae bacterium]|nr:DUF2752 domain-containing protein [Solirubrobacteraceae bacterium]